MYIPFPNCWQNYFTIRSNEVVVTLLDLRPNDFDV